MDVNEASAPANIDGDTQWELSRATEDNNTITGHVCDTKATGAYLTLLDEEAEQFTFMAIMDAGPKPRDIRVLHSSFDDARPHLEKLNRDGYGIFVNVNETDLTGRKLENMKRVRSLYIEQDRPGAPEPPLVPNFVVESSPGKFHKYLLVDGMTLEQFAPVQQRLVDDYGSDPNAKDLSRVLRLPGFYHLKDPARPHLVKIVEESGQPPYTCAQMVEALPPVLIAGRDAAAGIGGSVMKGTGVAFSNTQVYAKIAQLSAALAHISPDMDYQQWVDIGMGLKDASNTEDMLNVWRRWSALGSMFRPGECEYRWQSFKRRDREEKVSISTVFWYARMDDGVSLRPAWDGRTPVHTAEQRALVAEERKRLLEQFSSQHRVLNALGQARIVSRQLDEGVDSHVTEFSTFSDFSALHVEKVPIVEWEDNTPVYSRVPMVPLWLFSEYRLQYNKIIFKPVAGKIAGGTTLPEGHAYNLYQGLAIAPVKNDRLLKPILDHILIVLCGGDKTLYAWFIRWAAYMYQHPGEPGHSVPIFIGEEGTGKNLVLDIFPASFGSHGLMVSDKSHIVGDFNDHLATSVCVFSNEAEWSGRDSLGVWKGLITDKTLSLHRKYMPRYSVKNCVHMLVSSNSDSPVPVGFTDRRHVFFQVSNDRYGDSDYFKSLSDTIDNGGAAALIHHLLNLPLGDWSPRFIPREVNSAKIAQKLEGSDSITQWWYECLQAGEFIFYPRGANDQGVAGQCAVASEEWLKKSTTLWNSFLFPSYQSWCQRHSGAIVATDSAVTRKLRKLCPRHVVARDSKKRGTCVPQVEVCRESFEVISKDPIDWLELEKPFSFI